MDKNNWIKRQDKFVKGLMNGSDHQNVKISPELLKWYEHIDTLLKQNRIK